jgi:hypothetical protein
VVRALTGVRLDTATELGVHRHDDWSALDAVEKPGERRVEFAQQPRLGSLLVRVRVEATQADGVDPGRRSRLDAPADNAELLAQCTLTTRGGAGSLGFVLGRAAVARLAGDAGDWL